MGQSSTASKLGWITETEETRTLADFPGTGTGRMVTEVSTAVCFCSVPSKASCGFVTFSSALGNFCTACLLSVQSGAEVVLT